MTTRKKRPSQGGRAVSLLMLQSREIGAAEFKARCLEVMDEVQRTGVEVVITKHRKPVARLVPMPAEVRPFCGFLKDWIIEVGDVVSPTGEIWTADESNFN